MTVSYECKNNQWPGTLKHLKYNQTVRSNFEQDKNLNSKKLFSFSVI